MHLQNLIWQWQKNNEQTELFNFTYFLILFCRAKMKQLLVVDQDHLSICESLN
jgi:hypothetical protein